MPLETTDSLNRQTLEALQELTQLNIDSAEGFHAAAEDCGDIRISQLFVALGTERKQQAAELQKYLLANDVTPCREGSTVAALHRAWTAIRTALSGHDPHTALCEAERGEDRIKGRYERALRETAGSAVNDVLMRQYAQVKSAHDRVRNLRDQLG
ncbi:PA2169 family four-helix-bundle protein [Roseimaritima sediminicola]|uniref:PA2169 family four-helix-bundle protein n=1 Tax=Roseimaritima sediminicola TaxID=2662066 RepID=UPI0012984B48|nr:PA2169 family four-helix-bundle protein [Roseimaritima sediminicola]